MSILIIVNRRKRNPVHSTLVYPASLQKSPSGRGHLPRKEEMEIQIPLRREYRRSMVQRRPIRRLLGVRSWGVLMVAMTTRVLPTIANTENTP